MTGHETAEVLSDIPICLIICLKFSPPEYNTNSNDIRFLEVCSYHVTYTFYSESTICSSLNVKELLDRNRCDITSLSDGNGIRTLNS